MYSKNSKQINIFLFTMRYCLIFSIDLADSFTDLDTWVLLTWAFFIS